MEDKEEREWVVYIKEELRAVATREETPNPCIFMACSPLRGLQLNAFIPQVVAIGPLHNDLGPHHSLFPENSETQRYKTIAVAEMEKHKIMASHDLLSTSLPGCDFCKLVDAFIQDIGTVRSKYGTVLACKSDEKLAYMLALDAAFVVQVLRSNTCTGEFSSYYCSRLPNPLRKSILQDFVLLENQVPLFLLVKTIKMFCLPEMFESEKEALQMLKGLVTIFASEVLPFSARPEDECVSSVVCNLGEREHLLDCLYGIVTHSTLKHDGSSPSKLKVAVDKPTHFPSAKELQNCGVRFKPVVPGNMSSVYFDPKRATLYVPQIRVGDETERLMRNLIAYESHLVDSLQVLSYLRFMNGLVDTPKDVALLVKKGIIAQDIGSNEHVAKMWNKLCMSTMRVCTPEYEDVAVQLLHHCQCKMNALKAEFKKTYLSRPWLVTSLLSGAALLLMTFITTYYTIKLYLKPGG